LIERHRIKIRGNTVHFKKGESGCNRSALIAIETGLSLRYMKKIGGCDVEKITVTVMICLLRLRDGTFKQTAISNPVRTSKPLDRFFVEAFDAVDGQKYRLTHKASLRIKAA
jgi:hypothetical protein